VVKPGANLELVSWNNRERIIGIEADYVVAGINCAVCIVLAGRKAQSNVEPMKIWHAEQFVVIPLEYKRAYYQIAHAPRTISGLRTCAQVHVYERQQNFRTEVAAKKTEL